MEDFITVAHLMSILDEFTPILIYQIIDGNRTIIFDDFVDKIPANLKDSRVLRVTLGKEKPVLEVRIPS